MQTVEAERGITTPPEHARVLPVLDAGVPGSYTSATLTRTRPAKVLSPMRAPVQAGGSHPLTFHMLPSASARGGKTGPQRWARVVMLMDAHWATRFWRTWRNGPVMDQLTFDSSQVHLWKNSGRSEGRSALRTAKLFRRYLAGYAPMVRRTGSRVGPSAPNAGRVLGLATQQTAA